MSARWLGAFLFGRGPRCGLRMRPPSPWRKVTLVKHGRVRRSGARVGRAVCALRAVRVFMGRV